MKHERIYWLCQITGWSLYTISTVMLSAAFGVYSWSNFASQVLSCAVGLMLTHLFRVYVRRHGWLRLSLPSLVPRIVAVCIFGAILWMMLMMPLFMGFMFYGISSGLVLYWLTGNVVGIVQQWFINRFMPAPAPVAAKTVITRKVRK